MQPEVHVRMVTSAYPRDGTSSSRAARNADRKCYTSAPRAIYGPVNQARRECPFPMNNESRKRRTSLFCADSRSRERFGESGC